MKTCIEGDFLSSILLAMYVFTDKCLIFVPYAEMNLRMQHQTN